MDHVAEEIGLLRLRALGHRHVRQHLLLQDLLGIPYTALAGETSRRTTIPDEVQSNLRRGQTQPPHDREDTYVAVLNDETVVYTRLQHFEHLGVLHVVANMLQNIAVRNDTKGTEYDPDWYVDLNVRNGCFHDIARLIASEDEQLKVAGSEVRETHRLFLVSMEHLHLELTDRLATFLNS